MEDEEKEKADSIGIKSFSWNDFIHMGSEHPSELQAPQATDICMIMYTSGTNGDSKVAVLTHDNAITNICGIDIHMEQFEDKTTVDDVYLSFMPLAHILDRIIEEYFFRKGASVGFYHGIWVYGDSFKSSLVAVVVPNQEQAEKRADQSRHRSSFSNLCTLTQLRDYILYELKSIGERNKFRGFEQIKGVVVEAETFEGEKDLLTATVKKKRDKSFNNHKVQIDNLYTNVG